MGDGSLDGYNLIGDEATPTLGSELITGFTNGDTYPLDTLTTSGRDVSSAIETSGDRGGFASNQINATIGDVYRCKFNLTYNSGTRTMRTRFALADSGSASTRGHADYLTDESGSHTFYFLATATDSTSYLQFGTWAEADTVNFSLTDVSVKKLNGNPAVMVNMEAMDITGDTP